MTQPTRLAIALKYGIMLSGVATLVITFGEFTMQIKLRKIGNSLGITFPKEVLDKFSLGEGDILTLMVMEDGIKLMVYDPNFDQVMEVYKQGASQYRNALRQLADG
ncbi:AbrB/MazE/SpoVT family DNA-binding domain-containing protein [uncultured Nostoc sp.]|uniref:AbrB/MazE/SpoVT family DNA-binding domain-containing protein n=1 Tax=uncultured Nostoc sp. TaxID=340711 RepID=UPI0035CAC695